MTRESEAGAGPAGLDRLRAVLDRQWSVWPDLLVSTVSAFPLRCDAVLLGPSGLFVVDFFEISGRSRVTPWEWQLPDGSWIPSPAVLLARKARALMQALRTESELGGPLDVRPILALPEEAEIEGAESAFPRGIVACGREAILHRLRGPELEAPRRSALRQGLESVLDAGTTAARIPGAVGGESLRLLEIYRGSGLFEANLGARETTILKVWPVLESPDPKRLELLAWQARILEENRGCPGFVPAGPGFQRADAALAQSIQLPGIRVASWRHRYPQASAEARHSACMALAEAVAALHRHGLVHGELGPWSLRLEDSEFPRTAWFEPFDLERSDIHFGSDPGTTSLRFLAPERRLGWGSALPVTDQFGLGVAMNFVWNRLAPPGNGPAFGLVTASGIRSVLDRLTAHRPVDRFRQIEDVLESLNISAGPRSGSRNEERLAPGLALDADHEVVAWIHEGRRCSVYQVRHLPSGQPRTLKLARAEVWAEAALDREGQTLGRLNHPRLPRWLGEGPVLEGRRSFLLEWMPGLSLAEMLQQPEPLDEATIRRCSNDLMDILLYLHREGVTHRDLRPGHLLIGEGRLALLDFSGELARPGTRYRDPVAGATDAGLDRYAAALCLYELWTGRQAFASGGPQPGAEPEIEAEQFEGADGGTMAGVLRRALHPNPAERYPSIRDFRAALVSAQRFSQRPGVVEAVEALRGLGKAAESASVDCLALAPAAKRALKRGGVLTLGELATLEPESLERLPGAGRRIRGILRSLSAELRAAGMSSPAPLDPAEEMPLRIDQASDEALIDVLDFPPGLKEKLGQAGYRTVGELALSRRGSLRRLPGIGPSGFGRVLRGLALRESVVRSQSVRPATLEDFWNALCGELDSNQRDYLEARFGIDGSNPKSAKSLSKRFPFAVDPGREERLLGNLVPELVSEAVQVLQSSFLAGPGWCRLETLCTALEYRWPREGAVDSVALVRLLGGRLGWVFHEHRRLNARWVSRSEADVERLVRATIVSERRLSQPRRPAASISDQLRELDGFRQVALEPWEDRALDELPLIPDFGVVEAGIRPAEERLADWVRQGRSAQADTSDLVAELGTDGLLLGWVAEGGDPEQLVEAGLLLSCGEPRPPSLVPKGLRKITAGLSPAMESSELRDRTVALGQGTLPLLPAPVREALQQRVTRSCLEGRLESTSSELLALAWRQRCEDLAASLAAGAPDADARLWVLRQHAEARRNGEELDLLTELARLARGLFRTALSQPLDLSGRVALRRARQFELFQPLDWVAVRLQRCRERTPHHFDLAGHFLQRLAMAVAEEEAALAAEEAALAEEQADRAETSADSLEEQASSSGEEARLVGEASIAEEETRDPAEGAGAEEEPRMASRAPVILPEWWDLRPQASIDFHESRPEIPAARSEPHEIAPTAAPAASSQLELHLRMAALEPGIELPSALDELERRALRTVLVRGAVTERELVTDLGLDMASLFGLLSRLQARLEVRQVGGLRIEQDATGQTLFMPSRAAGSPKESVQKSSSRAPAADPGWDLRRAAWGGSIFRLVPATDFAALEGIEDFAVASIRFSPDSLPASPLRFYRQLTEATRLAGGGLAQRLQHWLYEVLLHRTEPQPALEAALRHLSGAPFDFPRVLAGYWKALERGDLVAANSILGWLSGQPVPVSQALKAVGLRKAATDNLVPWLLRLVLTWLRQTGFAGWCVQVRGAEILADPKHRPLAHSFAWFRHWIQEGRLPGLVLFLGVEPELDPEERQALERLLQQPPDELPRAVVAPSRPKRREAPVTLSLFGDLDA